jgi:multiple sugar transport system permease protein
MGGRLARLSPNAKESIAGYVFLTPFLLGFLGLGLGPMVASLWLSFTRYDLLNPPKWIGVDNYTALFADPRYLKSIEVTATFVFVSVPAKLALALVFAVLLNRGLGGLRIYRTIYYVPSLLGGSVAIAVLWRELFDGDGVVNTVLRFLGWSNPPNWLADPNTALYTLVILAVWEFGGPMIIFLAGLRQIPRDLYEVAQVDGASKLAQFRHITVPLITPIILFNLVMGVIGSFQAFTGAYIISGGKGGPVDSTLFYTLYLYQEGFGYLHMGYASAMAWLLVVIIGVLTAAIFGTSGRWVFYMEQAK